MTTQHPPTADPKINHDARQAAIAAAERLSIPSTGIVRYNSRGRVLVIGGEQAQWFAARLQHPLHAEILLTEGDTEPGAPTTPLADRECRVFGHLGAFRVELGQQNRHHYQELQADLIVDFGQTPVFDNELPPLGYWRFGQAPQDLDAAEMAVDGMVGTFEKPRFFDYDPGICAHARAGITGCTRCIDSCPADAIISIGERVEVNPNLCQGGGICASVCPSGAMRYAYPPPMATASRVQTLLKAYLNAGGTDPVVLFLADADASEVPTLAPNVLLVAVEELASVGHELWLAALAWGAGCVMLADGGSVPSKSRGGLEDQLGLVHDILEAAGIGTQAVRLINLAEAPAHCQPVNDLRRTAAFSAEQPKRQLATMAIDHLLGATKGLPPRIALEDGAPYGELLVDDARCALCMSCTSVCPAGALSAGDETPRLVFHEINCVQCGICANACPESAIRLAAGYATAPDQRRAARVLHEEPPFCCITCGKPFATHKVIDNILDKLADHAMFQSDRARRRLQMCQDCRVVDAVQDTEAMQAGLFAANYTSNNGQDRT